MKLGPAFAWWLVLAAGCGGANQTKTDGAADTASVDGLPVCGLGTWDAPYDVAVDLCSRANGPCTVCLQAVDCDGKGAAWGAIPGDCVCPEPYELAPVETAGCPTK